MSFPVIFIGLLLIIGGVSFWVFPISWLFVFPSFTTLKSRWDSASSNEFCFVCLQWLFGLQLCFFWLCARIFPKVQVYDSRLTHEYGTPHSTPVLVPSGSVPDRKPIGPFRKVLSVVGQKLLFLWTPQSQWQSPSYRVVTNGCFRHTPCLPHSWSLIGHQALSLLSAELHVLRAGSSELY